MLKTIARPLVAGLGALALASSAFAANYVVDTPTAAPYYKTDPIIHGAGSFSDTFSFSVAATTDSFIWVLPYNPLDISAFWVGTHDVQVSLFNSANTLIGTGKTAAQLGINLYSDPATAAYALTLKAAGYDPAKSLFWSGSLAAGTYTATVTGLAGGLFSDTFGGGGAYIAKFSVPSAVPEPSTQAMLAGGMLILGTVAMRRRLKARSNA